MLPNQIQNVVLMTREQAAEYLGVSASTLANWACTQKFTIPYCKLGRSVRYRQSDLDAFIQSCEVDYAHTHIRARTHA